jgi:putative sterol carrier protein
MRGAPIPRFCPGSRIQAAGEDRSVCNPRQPDPHVTTDSQTWIGFLKKEKNVVWAFLRRKIRLDGPLKLLVAFGKCFPQ